MELRFKLELVADFSGKIGEGPNKYDGKKSVTTVCSTAPICLNII